MLTSNSHAHVPVVVRDNNKENLVKFADDLTLSIPVKLGTSNSNSATNGVQSIVEWTSINRMQLTFKKTWEMLLKGRSTKALPVPLVSIERKPTQLFSPIRVTGIYIWIIFYRKLVVVCTSDVFVNSMDCRWIIFIFFLLVLSYLYLHMLWKY